MLWSAIDRMGDILPSTARSAVHLLYLTLGPSSSRRLLVPHEQLPPPCFPGPRHSHNPGLSYVQAFVATQVAS